MIGTSAVLQDDFSESFTIPQVRYIREEKTEDIAISTDLWLTITDHQSGKPISNAMISIDSQGRTAISDPTGKVSIQKVLTGRFMLDVIVPGYIANSSMIQISSQHPISVNIMMIRNC